MVIYSLHKTLHNLTHQSMGEKGGIFGNSLLFFQHNSEYWMTLSRKKSRSREILVLQFKREFTHVAPFDAFPMMFDWKWGWKTRALTVAFYMLKLSICSVEFHVKNLKAISLKAFLHVVEWNVATAALSRTCRHSQHFRTKSGPVKTVELRFVLLFYYSEFKMKFSNLFHVSS